MKFLLLSLGIVALVSFMGARIQHVNLLNRTYSSVVARMGGTLRKGNLLRKPAVDLVYSGLSVNITVFTSTGRRDDKYMTQFRISWPDPTLRCSLYPDRGLYRVSKLIGLKDIKIGDSAFDRRYIIMGPNETLIRELLSAPVRHHINALYGFRGTNHAYLQFGGGQLVIKKRGLLKHPHTMLRFVDLCLAIVDSAIILHSGDIQFLEGTMEIAEVVIDEAYCQICGESATSDVVFCKSCATPHHRDCWEYYGSCSTYGCGQVRYVDKPNSG